MLGIKEYNEDYGMGLSQAAKVGIGVAGIILLAVAFRFTAVKRIPANTVGVKVSAFGGVQETTLQTGYHLKMPIEIYNNYRE